MEMPAPDQGVIARRDEIAAALRLIVPGEGVIVSEPERRAYESDGLTAYRQPPLVVVLPSTLAQVSAVLRYCKDEGIKVVPRGAGTSLSGGALPLADGVLLGMAKFNRILDIDYDNRCVVAQPGVTNLGISHAVADAGFYYAPDPSSQIACTIGGKHLDAEGYDLMGVMTGSEGLLGVVTEVTVRILRRPPTARALLIGFAETEDAGNCVAAVIGAGIIPGGMEMMDRPAIHAAEAFVECGYPLDVEALLIVELDGPPPEVDHLIAKVEGIASANRARSVRVSRDEAERLAFWSGRKAAFPAVGRISPDYYCMDGTIPRKRLGEMLLFIGAMEKKYGLRCPNVFHAGDGNLHPLILFDANNADQLHRTELFAGEVLEKCIEVGGTITGEHGVGIEKINQMCVQFRPDELDAFRAVKRAFDPRGLLNPGKAVPTLARCAEYGRMPVSGGKLPHAELPRF